MSQTKKILNHLQNKGMIDPITALKKYGSFRLAARISNLRDAGFDITTKIVKHQGKRFAVYLLNEVNGTPI